MASEKAIDRKLSHIVRKLVDADDIGDNRAVVAAALVKNIRQKHREYQRRDAKALQLQVQAVLEQLQREQQQQMQEDDNDDEYENLEDAHDDGSYERAALAQEEMRDQMQLGTGLNASLRTTYQQISQEKQQQQNNTVVVEETAVTSNEDGEAATNTTTTCAATNNQNNNNNNNNTPKRKKRKRVLRRASSSNVNGEYGTDTDTSLAFLTPLPRPKERYHDLGGLDALIQEVRQLVEYPLTRPELYRHLGIEPPRGVLLRGPPGTGKTHLATAVAGELGVPFFSVSAPALVTGVSGESEGRVRQLFQTASDAAPALVFLDELDAVAAKRADSGRGMAGKDVDAFVLEVVHMWLGGLVPRVHLDQVHAQILETNRIAE